MGSLRRKKESGGNKVDSENERGECEEEERRYESVKKTKEQKRRNERGDFEEEERMKEVRKWRE